MQEISKRPKLLLLVLIAGIAVSFQAAISWQTFSTWMGLADPTKALVQGTWPIVFLLQVLTPFLCLTFGLYVTAVRVEDPRAWLLLGVLITFGVAMDGVDVHDSVMAWVEPINHLALLYRTVCARGWAICLMLFSIYFPDRAAFDVRRPALKWLFLIPCLSAFVLVGLETIGRNEAGAWLPLSLLLHKCNAYVFPVLTWFPILVFCFVLLVKFRSATGGDSRRRLRLLLVGLALSLIPPEAFGTLMHTFLHLPENAFGGWLEFAAYLPLAFLPIVLAYVVIIDKALDVRVVVRQSLRYALARRGLSLVQVLISGVVIGAIAIESGQQSFVARLLITTVGVGLILCIGLGGQHLASWIDRRFFRDAYRAEQILVRLAENIRSVLEISPLLHIVHARVSEALHVLDFQIYLGTGDVFQRALVSETSTWNDAGQTAILKTGRAREDKSGRLLIPLLGRTELLGFFCVGPRVSEAPYSPNDIQLMQSVAAQTSFAIENSNLTRQIAAETAQQEVVHRELAIARDVQQRLLPQEQPQIPGVVYAASCRPAQEVGGDYYDYFRVPGNAIGIAIGDVSGKGIPASLLMASLQASLRGQAMREALGVDCIVKNVNQQIWTTSPANRYATFFYAQYEPTTRVLTYCNGGHNAPFWLRGDGEIVRLQTGGPPVGLFEHSSYSSERIQMNAGDLLMLYTDGISEAMNAKEEEWGEPDMAELLKASVKHSPESILSDVFSRADLFSAGEPQHDDMTAMIFAFMPMPRAA